jgi:hypothetical protein
MTLRHLSALAALLLTGCVSATEKFYRPYTTRTFAPKPEKHPIPIFGKPPDRPYEAIGRFTFSKGGDYDFMIEAIEHNARKVGADAAIMLASRSQPFQFAYNVPGYTTTQPVTTNLYGYSTGALGYTSRRYAGTATSYVPVTHQGYTAVKTGIRHSVDAEMIVYK